MIQWLVLQLEPNVPNNIPGKRGWEIYTKDGFSSSPVNSLVIIWLGSHLNSVVCMILALLWLLYGTLSWKQLSPFSSAEWWTMRSTTEDFLKEKFRGKQPLPWPETAFAAKQQSQTLAVTKYVWFTKDACLPKDHSNIKYSFFPPNQQVKPEVFLPSIFQEDMCQAIEKCLCTETLQISKYIKRPSTSCT